MKRNDIIMELQMEISALNTHIVNLADNIKAQGELGAEIIKQNQALSLQVQVLREALEEIKSYEADDVHIQICAEALSTTPNQDEWIRKDTLELEGYWKQGDDLDESDYFPIADFPSVNTTGCTPLYRIKETTK